MICRAILLLSSFVLLGALKGEAEEARPPAETIASDPFYAMQEFARCRSRFEFAATIAQTAGKPAGAEEYMGASRGSGAVANFFAMYLALESADGDDVAYAEAISARLNQVENFYQLEMTRQLAFSERGEMDVEGFKYCFDLQPTQIRVIEQMRRDGLM